MGHDCDSVVLTVLVEKKEKTKAISDMICELFIFLRLWESLKRSLGNLGALVTSPVSLWPNRAPASP